MLRPVLAVLFLIQPLVCAREPGPVPEGLALKAIFSTRGTGSLPLPRAVELYSRGLAAKGLKTAQRIDLLLRRGEALGALGKGEEALKDFQEALRLSPGNPVARWQIAGLTALMGGFTDSEKTIRELRAIIKTHPDFVPAYVSLGALHLKLGDEKKCIALCTTAISKKPETDDLAWTYYTRATAYFQLREWKACLEDVSRAIELDPAGRSDPASQYLMRGYAYLALGEPSRALTNYEMAQLLAPKSPEPLRGIWRIHYLRERYALCYFLAEELMKLDKKGEMGLVSRALACYQLGRFDEGLTASRQAVERAPKSAYARSLLAAGFAAKGDFKRAFANYDKALACDRSSYHALTGTAYLYATCPDAKYRDGAKALVRVNKVVKEWPGTGARSAIPLLVTLAEQGKFDEALAGAQQCLKGTPKGSPERRACERLLLSVQKKEKPTFCLEDFKIIALTVEAGPRVLLVP